MEKTEDDNLGNVSGDENINMEIQPADTESDNETPDEVVIKDEPLEVKEKPVMVKAKKPRSEAQIKAFERCRQIRAEKTAQRKKEKLAKQYEAYKQTKTKPRKKKEVLSSESEDDEPIQKVKVKKTTKPKTKPKKKPKKKIIYESASSSSSSDDSSSEEEVVVRKKKRRSKQVKFKEEAQEVDTNDYFNIV